MTTAPNRQLLTVALGNLGGHEHSVHTEDVALEADRLLPGRFTWRKYPQYIDINVVLQGLGDARRKKYGEYVIGNNVKGWMLSKAGQIWLKTVLASDQSELSLLIGSGKGSLIFSQRQELYRLRKSDAFHQFANGQIKEITRSHLFEFARVNEYFSTKARVRRFNFVAATVQGEKHLQELWGFFESNFESEFK